MHLLVCYLNKLQTARCNDKDIQNLSRFVEKKKLQQTHPPKLCAIHHPLYDSRHNSLC